MCERRAGESCRAPDPRPKNPRSLGTSRCIPGATPEAPQLEEISGGVFGHIISLRFITGKSPVSRPSTHRNTADMPAIAAKEPKQSKAAAKQP